MRAAKKSAKVIRFPVERRRDITAIDLLKAIEDGLRQVGSRRFRMTIRIEGIDES